MRTKFLTRAEAACVDRACAVATTVHVMTGTDHAVKPRAMRDEAPNAGVA